MNEAERELDLKLGEAMAEIRRLNEILARQAAQQAQQQELGVKSVAQAIDDRGVHPHNQCSRH